MDPSNRLTPLLRTVEEDVEAEIAAVASSGSAGRPDAGELERYDGLLHSLQGAVRQSTEHPSTDWQVAP